MAQIFEQNGQTYKAFFTHYVRGSKKSPGGEEEDKQFQGLIDCALRDGSVNPYYVESSHLPETANLKKVHACTVCVIETFPGRVSVAHGYAFAGPEDQFNKKKGRQIAFGRAKVGIPITNNI